MRYRPEQRRTFLLLGLLALAISQVALHLTLPTGNWWMSKFASPPGVGQQEHGKNAPPGSETQAQSDQPSVFPNLHNRIIRFLAGGCLASIMWYYLFNYPSVPFCDAWPPGMMDAAALGVLVMLGCWLVKRCQTKPPAPSPPLPSFMNPQVTEAVELVVSQEAALGLAQVQAADPAFSLQGFSQDARQILRDFYAAWNKEDLEALEVLVTPEVFNFLRMGLQLLRMRGETNRVEDLALKRVVVAGAGRLEEREFILLWFKGRVVDYTLHRQTHKILAGSLTYPKEWEEYWCFEKQPGQEVWLVSDIREY